MSQHWVPFDEAGDVGRSHVGTPGTATVRMLWAFATMGTKPGERMMGQLERRAEAISGEFKLAGGCKDTVGVCDDTTGDQAGPRFCVNENQNNFEVKLWQD